MKIINGDIIAEIKNKNFDVFVHGCNCFHVMGGGVAKLLKDNFPGVLKADITLTKKGDRYKLGTYSCMIDGSVTIVNGYTQFGFGSDKCHLDYAALRGLFCRIKKDFFGSRIAYPKIGAGLAGGNWSIISMIIDEELEGMDHTLIEYGD